MPYSFFRSAFSALLAGALMACSATPDGRMETTDGSTQFVALQQSVEAGPVTILPIEVVEDSRCPLQAQCIRAGRLVLEALIAGPSWQQRVHLVLGQPQIVRDHRIVLSAVMPEAPAEGETKPGDYRFAFAIEEQI